MLQSQHVWQFLESSRADEENIDPLFKAYIQKQTRKSLYIANLNCTPELCMNNSDSILLTTTTTTTTTLSTALTPTITAMLTPMTLLTPPLQPPHRPPLPTIYGVSLIDPVGIRLESELGPSLAPVTKSLVESLVGRFFFFFGRFLF